MLPLNTKVLTSDGFVLVKNLRVNDVVYDEDGLPSIVLDVKDGIDDEYEIVFTDRTTIRCGERQPFKFRLKDKKVGFEESLINKYPLQNTAKERIISLPISKSVQFLEKNLILDPYLVGFMLIKGKFDKNGTLLCTTKDKYILKRIRSIVKNFNLTELQNMFIRELLATRQIPQEYLLSSVQDRLSLVQGLMDADGKLHNKLAFYHTNEEFINDFKFLIQSLGHRCRIKEKINKYRLMIRRPTAQLWSSLKLADRFFKYQKKIRLYCNQIQIKSIEKIKDKQPMKKIYTDSSKQTLIIENFIVVRNDFI